MINSLKLIRNIGRFDSVTTSPDLSFSQLTLIYAENGQGKTTISAILRSLATGNPIPVNERRRLAAPHPPHVIVNCQGEPTDAIFENGAWNRSFADITIFDDVFIDENVYSGLVVGSDHRQNLHELILGSQGVALNQQLRGHVARIEQHNTAIRQHSSRIPVNERGTLSVDNFCALPMNPNIDPEIQAVEQNLAASHQQDPIRNTPSFQPLQLPEIDLVAIETVLSSGISDIDAAAATRVQQHLQSIGDNSERWVAEGMGKQDSMQDADNNICVFCAQDLSASPIIAHYRGFFSEAYRTHQQTIQDTESRFNREHSSDVMLSFEQSVSALKEQRKFWSDFGQIPDITIDSTAIATDWRMAHSAISDLLDQKRKAPLNSIKISETVQSLVAVYAARIDEIVQMNQQLAIANQTIAKIKQRAAVANPADLNLTLTRLKATKARHMPATAGLCTAYLDEKQAKTATERQRDQTRQDLDQYRTQAFPAYEAAINQYLQIFNAGYQLDSVEAVDTRGGPTCKYNIVVNNTPVTVGGGNPEPGQHSFKNILSAGDRNTLAVAFFLASIDHDPNKANKVVVIDDPVSSLDEHRSLTTTQEIRRLINQVSQVVILSHSKPFLCRIWKSTAADSRNALQIVREGAASTITTWNVNSDLITENDRRHQMLRDYLENGGQNELEIATAIRPCLEAFLRVAYSEHFPPGTLLGGFCENCNSRAGTEQEILSQTDCDELRSLIEYANLFHHDTNSAQGTNTIDRAELEGFVNRMLCFAKRPQKQS